MNRRIWWGLLISAIAAVVFTSGWRWLHHSDSSGETRRLTLPMETRVPVFMLTDEAGRPFFSDSLSGKVWIADFIFTSCAGTCPQMTAQMQKLQRSLPDEVHLVSISVDPARDTPELLARYAQKAQANPERWHFLTGEPALIRNLVQNSFLLSVADGGSVQEPIVHSIRFVLVDTQGIIRGYYDGQDAQAVDQLVKDAQMLARAEEPE